MDAYLMYYTEQKVKDGAKILLDYHLLSNVVVKAPSIWDAEEILKSKYGNHITVVSIESVKIIG